jgi:3-oxoacyl-[acyl-carrier-protein] synthase-3
MSLPSRSRVLGWGAAVPNLVVTNDALSELVETSDEWIQKRTGIKERRYVDHGDGSVAIAEKAVADALAMSEVPAEDIDAIICCTLSPDIDFPGNASLLHDRLGLSPRMAFDIRNQCSGFVYALATADQLIRTGGARHVLIVGSEIHSSGLDFYGSRGRDVTVLFGDGAGAAVVGASPDDEHGLLSFKLHADGAYADKLAVVGPSGRRKPRLDASVAPPESPDSYPKMEGRFVFKHAVEGMTSVIKEVLDEAGYGVSDIDIVLPHQANLRINQFVAATLKLEERQVSNNIEKYGNTTAATLPLLLTETAAAGRVNRGDLVCFAAFGAGFTWGAALYRW